MQSISDIMINWMGVAQEIRDSSISMSFFDWSKRVTLERDFTDNVVIF